MSPLLSSISFVISINTGANALEEARDIGLTEIVKLLEAAAAGLSLKHYLRQNPRLD